MSENSTTSRYSLKEIQDIRDRGEDKLLHDAPEAEDMPPGFWNGATVVAPRTEDFVQLRLDREVLEWFRASGDEPLARINHVLRSYVEQQSRQR